MADHLQHRMKARFFIYTTLLVTHVAGMAQTNPKVNTSHEEHVYIPYDVADAVSEVERLLHPDDKGELSSPVGMQFRNLWRVWHGDTRLSQYFYDKGIYNGDLMWQIISNAYKAKRDKRPFDLKSELRMVLSRFQWNLPNDLTERPTEAVEAKKMTHYIQRDDLSVIFIFSTENGEPTWTYIRHVGWSRIEPKQLELLKQPTEAVILVPAPPPLNPPELIDPTGADPFKTKR